MALDEKQLAEKLRARNVQNALKLADMIPCDEDGMPCYSHDKALAQLEAAVSILAQELRKPAAVILAAAPSNEGAKPASPYDHRRGVDDNGYCVMCGEPVQDVKGEL